MIEFVIVTMVVAAYQPQDAPEIVTEEPERAAALVRYRRPSRARRAPVVA